MCIVGQLWGRGGQSEAQQERRCLCPQEDEGEGQREAWSRRVLEQKLKGKTITAGYNSSVCQGDDK